MPKEVPFDVWDGEDLATEEVIEADAAEEVAMHLDRESNLPAAPWSDLIDDRARDNSPVSYFEDEQPERSGVRRPARDDRQPDLEELLERQHYAFKPPGANNGTAT
jgi:hypothetical protein